MFGDAVNNILHYTTVGLLTHDINHEAKGNSQHDTTTLMLHCGDCVLIYSPNKVTKCGEAQGVKIILIFLIISVQQLLAPF